MSRFGRLFGRKSGTPQEMVIIQLNAKLQPVHRGEFFEDPIDARLKETGLGEVTGGGSLQEHSGEIKHCDIELTMTAATDEAIAELLAMLERLGAPRGSRVRVAGSGHERTVGTAEGLGLYLNGTDLPDEVYASSDSNHVYSELDRLLAGEGRLLSYWEGPTETAFHMYGGSFAEMHRRIADFIASYPLCQKCRIVQIA